MVLGDDPDLEPTEEELEDEEAEEPVMMRDAGYWDDFLKMVDTIQEEWAPPDYDTRQYREERAVKAFNAGTSQCLALSCLSASAHCIMDACFVSLVCRSQGSQKSQGAPRRAHVVGRAHFTFRGTAPNCRAWRACAPRL